MTGRCQARINGEWGPQCSFQGKIEVAGAWLCGTHAKQAPIDPRNLVSVAPASSRLGERP